MYAINWYGGGRRNERESIQSAFLFITHTSSGYQREPLLVPADGKPERINTPSSFPMGGIFAFRNRLAARRLIRWMRGCGIYFYGWTFTYVLVAVRFVILRPFEFAEF